MESFSESLVEYRKQMEKGAVPRAYRGLMEYIMGLRAHLKSKYPDYFVSGGIYHGFMDMTYFSFIPESYKRRNLKIAIVFLHEAFRFEVWLAGYNKQVQSKYWKLFKEHSWSKYHMVSTTKGEDSILECVLVDDPDFGDADALTKQIEGTTMKFIRDVESFLLKHS